MPSVLPTNGVVSGKDLSACDEVEADEPQILTA